MQFGQGGDTISFIGGTSRSLPTSLSFDCTPAASFTPPLESAGVYTYTATDTGTCSFDGLTSTSSVTFADASSLDPLFYFAGNEITVESTSTGGDVAPMRIDEIVVTSVNSITPISAVTFETTYNYSVTVVPSGSAVVEITPMAINDSGDDFTIGDPIELNNNGFMVPRRNYLENQLELLPLKPEITVDDLYLSIKAAIVGSSIDGASITHTVEYPILPAGSPLARDTDGDGVPDNEENPGEEQMEEVLLASASTGTAPGTTIEVPFGYRRYFR